MDIDRKTAFAVLLDIEKSEAFSNLALNRRIAENQPQNQAFVRELVYGLLKYKLLLDYQLDRLVKTGVRKLKKQDLTLLRMGMYQLIFMDSVPEYAAVSETVQMAKKYARGRESFAAMGAPACRTAACPAAKCPQITPQRKKNRKKAQKELAKPAPDDV